MSKSKINTLSSSEFVKLYQNSNSIAEMIRGLGLAVQGNHYRALKKRIKKEGLSLEVIKERGSLERTKGLKRTGKYFTHFEDVFCENSTYQVKGGMLKQRLLEAGVWKVEECFNCGQQPMWNGKTLTLQVDHINGISNDNRVENLRLLCPNCHSQTKTWGGRNIKERAVKKKEYFCLNCKAPVSNSRVKLCSNCALEKSKKIQWPNDQVIINLVSTYNWTKAGEILGVSDNAIRKHLERRGVDISRWREWGTIE